MAEAARTRATGTAKAPPTRRGRTADAVVAKATRAPARTRTSARSPARATRTTATPKTSSTRAAEAAEASRMATASKRADEKMKVAAVDAAREESTNVAPLDQERSPGAPMPLRVWRPLYQLAKSAWRFHPAVLTWRVYKGTVGNSDGRR